MIDMLQRLRDGGIGAKLAAVIGLVANLVLHDLFFGLFWLLVAANFADWIAGRWAARKLGTFNRKRSREGLQGKTIALMVLLLLRCIEEAVRVAGVPSSNGWVASAIASALVYEDVESLDQHRIAMGRSPIPLLSPALARLRLLSGAERRLESRAGQPAREDVS